MKPSLKILLYASALAVLLTGTATYFSNRQVNQLVSANVELGQLSARQVSATTALDDALAGLKAYLRDLQHRTEIPASYAEWAGQQQRAQTAVSTLGQRLADLETPATFPVAATVELTQALSRVRAGAKTLSLQWADYNQRGSGLSPQSQSFGTSTLKPLVTDELEPAIGALRTALQADLARKNSGVAALVSKARSNRMFSVFGLVAAVGVFVFALLRFIRESKTSQRSSPPSTPVQAKFSALIAFGGSKTGARNPGVALAILIVEPDLSERERISSVITHAGFTPTACSNVPDAISVARSGSFELMVLDQQLPGDDNLGKILQAGLSTQQWTPLGPGPLSPNDPAGKAVYRVLATLPKPINTQILLSIIAETFPSNKAKPSAVAPPVISDRPRQTPAALVPRPLGRLAPEVVRPMSEVKPAAPPAEQPLPRLVRRKVTLTDASGTVASTAPAQATNMQPPTDQGAVQQATSPEPPPIEPAPAMEVPPMEATPPAPTPLAEAEIVFTRVPFQLSGYGQQMQLARNKPLVSEPVVPGSINPTQEPVALRPLTDHAALPSASPSIPPMANSAAPPPVPEHDIGSANTSGSADQPVRKRLVRKRVLPTEESS